MIVLSILELSFEMRVMLVEMVIGMMVDVIFM